VLYRICINSLVMAMTVKSRRGLPMTSKPRFSSGKRLFDVQSLSQSSLCLFATFHTWNWIQSVDQQHDLECRCVLDVKEKTGNSCAWHHLKQLYLVTLFHSVQNPPMHPSYAFAAATSTNLHNAPVPTLS
jgi:hypothetical protein